MGQYREPRQFVASIAFFPELISRAMEQVIRINLSWINNSNVQLSSCYFMLFLTISVVFISSARLYPN